MKRKLLKFIWLLSIPCTISIGYDVFNIVKSKDMLEAISTAMLFLVQIIYIIGELIRDE